ncbi:MAG: hypothetical protein HOO06_15955 [Bdellovibrionaceae bacterium]|jgi:hypothetical protein|nr:hypothetical protein [Pseudobdellovibrionaceae bacterium]
MYYASILRKGAIIVKNLILILVLLVETNAFGSNFDGKWKLKATYCIYQHALIPSASKDPTYSSELEIFGSNLHQKVTRLNCQTQTNYNLIFDPHSKNLVANDSQELVIENNCKTSQNRELPTTYSIQNSQSKSLFAVITNGCDDLSLLLEYVRK